MVVQNNQEQLAASGVITPSVLAKLKDDLRGFGTAIYRTKADGTIERIDPADFFVGGDHRTAFRRLHQGSDHLPTV